MARRAGAEPVPLCPVYPPVPSWLQRKSLCCSETNSSDPDCFPSRGLKSVGKQTQLNRMKLSPPKGRMEHWGLWVSLSAKVPNMQLHQPSSRAGQVQRKAKLRRLHGFCEVTMQQKDGPRVQGANEVR